MKFIEELKYKNKYTDYQLAEIYNRSIDMIRLIIRDDSNKSYDNPVPSLSD